MMPELLSDAQKTAFEKDGVIKLSGVLTPEDINLLRGAIGQQIRTLNTTTTGYDFQSLSDQLWAGVNDDEISAGEANRFELELCKFLIESDDEARPITDPMKQARTDRGLFFHDAGGWRLYDGITQIALDSALPETCATLMDSEYVNFWEDATFVKMPNTPQRTVFHQDYTYFQITGKKCCIIWIPLDSATRKNGAMQYIRGSHLWGKHFAPNMFIAQTPMLDAADPKLPDIENNLDEYDIVTIEAEPGDIIIHDVRTVHGSGGNTSIDLPRRAISLRYCGDDIRYLDKPGAIPQPYVNSHLPNGARLTGDDYPLVWPRPGHNQELAPRYQEQNLAQ